MRPLMCLHRGCGKLRRSQKCRKCKGQDKVEKLENLLPQLVAVAVRQCQFLFTYFFDSSCYRTGMRTLPYFQVIDIYVPLYNGLMV